MDGTTNLGPPAPLNGSATTMLSTVLAVGAHNITALYSGDHDFLSSVSPAWTQVVTVIGGTNSTATVLTSAPSQTFFRQKAVFFIQAYSPGVVPGAISPPGNVVLLDGNRQLGPVLTLAANGTATYSTPLSIGTHNVRAVYLGSGLFNGSTSSTQTVSTSPRPQPR